MSAKIKIYKRPPYTCCRCSYSTEKKASMIHHFYKLKKPCPCPGSIEKEINLTEDIKQHILKNRLYVITEIVPEKIVQQQVIQQINTNNFITNFISTVDPMVKLEHYLEHQKIETMSFPQTIKNTFKNNIKRLQSKPRSYILNPENILDTIDAASTHNHVRKINIMFKNKTKRLMLFRDNTWGSYQEDRGINEIINEIKEAYIDEYECYLIYKLHQFDGEGRQVEREPFEKLLFEYYKFINIFGLKPLIDDMPDYDILNFTSDDKEEDDEENDSEDDDHSATTICDKYLIVFKRAVDSTTKQEIREIRKKVIDIIKRNCQASLDLLNEQVTRMFNMDETFKQKFLSYKSIEE